MLQFFLALIDSLAFGRAANQRTLDVSLPCLSCQILVVPAAPALSLLQCFLPQHFPPQTATTVAFSRAFNLHASLASLLFVLP